MKAGYQDEIQAAVKHFTTVGWSRIALLHAKDSFGQDALIGFENAMRRSALTPVGVSGSSRDRARSRAR